MTFDDYRFIDAIVNDSIDIVAKFLPIPKETIKWLFSRMKKDPVNEFLNIDMDWIFEFYRNDRVRLLSFQIEDKLQFLPQYVVIDNTSKCIENNNILFKFTDDVFEVSEEIIDLTNDAFSKLSKKRNFTNEENLRLSKIDYQNGVYTLYTQPVYYYSYLHTNLVMDYSRSEGKSLREKYHKNGLEKIEESKFANHIGINILLFTSGGSLILPLRSNKVSYAPSELSASISGAVSTNDISDGDTLNDLSIIREGIEELGLKRTDIDKESITFLGLTRELIRGGKPELFFSLKTNLSKEDIKSRWSYAKDKWENKTLEFFQFGNNTLKPLESIEEYENFHEQLKKFFEKYSNKMSLPLLTNIVLWKKMKQNEIEVKESLKP